MHQEDRTLGVASTAEALDAAVGRIDMWGDRVVGSTEKELTTLEESTEPIHILGKCYLHRDGDFYTHYNNGSKKKLSINKNQLNVWVDSRSRKTIDRKETLAKHLLPNPLGLPYVRVIDNKKPVTLDNIKWSAFPNVLALAKVAVQAELHRARHPEIFKPQVEIPETITLKSRV